MLFHATPFVRARSRARYIPSSQSLKWFTGADLVLKVTDSVTAATFFRS